MYLIGFYSKKNLYKLNKFDYYKRSFNDLKKKWVTTIYFYEDDPSVVLEQDIIDGIKAIWVDLVWFKDESEIISHVKTLQWKIFINTFEEQEIDFTNRIRKLLGQKTTSNPRIFLNKYLQRKTIWEKYPETIVQYKQVSIEEAKNMTDKDFPPFPCIIKPTWWVQSSWVCKIENYEQYKTALNTTLSAFKMLENKRLTNQAILIEEFIDGKMYTIDYYVDEDQNMILSQPVFIKLWIDYGIDDFCNVSRFISHEIETEVNKEKLHEFIKKTVLGWEIRNTFVHHEFKINSKWEFKTIETNWRIWWFRLDMYQLWYNMNLLLLPFEQQHKDFLLQKNIAMFALYPSIEWLFNGYNEEILSTIYSLKSFHRINKWIKTVWYPLWLTHNWYGKAWSIELMNDSFDDFKRDIAYIEKKYFDIIDMQ